MNQYKIMKDRHEREYEQETPAKYAFNDDQGRRMFNEWGLDYDNPADAEKVRRVGPGVYVLADDVPLFFGLLRRLDNETKAAIAADTTGEQFVRDMFLIELADHEYTYTRRFDETLEALGYTDQDLIDNAALRHGLQQAAADLLAGADEYEEEV